MKDLTGQIFGEWKVLEYLGGSQSQWKCKCSCGEIYPVRGDRLRSGTSTKCKICSRKVKIDLVGKQFGNWYVVKYLGKSQWECKCSCGEIQTVNGSNLRSGRSTLCGFCSGRWQPMLGKRFGRLVVKQKGESQRYKSPNGKHSYTRLVWLCDCDCGIKNHPVTGDHLRNLGTKSCGQCDYKSIQISKHKRVHGGTIDGPERGQTIEYQLFSRAKRRAKEQALPFDLDIEDIKVPKNCPVFGWPLIKGKLVSNDQSPSLDRIDPSRGYVKGNTWVISHFANRIKNNASIGELEAVVKALKKVAG